MIAKLARLTRMNRALWDNDDFTPDQRRAFEAIIKCRTLELGGMYYSAECGEHKIVPFTCKNRNCPSCGHKRTLLWLEEAKAKLPDVPYRGFIFTMQKTLWNVFLENRHLLKGLPAIAAGVLQNSAISRFNADLAILCVTHTFGSKLSFKPHLHVLVSTVGLDRTYYHVVSDIWFFKDLITREWRYGVIDYLREALVGGSLKTSLSHDGFLQLLDDQWDTYWKPLTRPVESFSGFIDYVGRYIRRPPLAERNIVCVDANTVEIRTKDTKAGKKITFRITINQLFRLLALHFPDPKSHGMRYFGLLSPQSRRHKYRIFCAQLGLGLPKRKKPMSWSEIQTMTFGIDPLLDSNGIRMNRSHYILPVKY